LLLLIVVLRRRRWGLSSQSLIFAIKTNSRSLV
jgi:hypothetical protein